MQFSLRLALCLCTLLLTAPPLAADVRLPKVLSSGMVLQRDSDVKIWGWADPGEEVHVRCSWLNTIARAKAAETGWWIVTVKTGRTAGPHRLSVQGGNRIDLSNILFGEVWLASGQSNMEMPLTKVSGAYTGIHDAGREIAAADHPRIRLFQVGNFSSNEPLDDVEEGIVMYGIPKSDCKWHSCSPKSVPTFPATAYFFARELHRKLNVPIGIIDSSWGGTSAEAWTPTAGLKSLSGYDADLKQAADLPQQANRKVPTRLYNGMIHPLRNVRIKGAIWYQGEGNTRRADRYHRLFSEMIGQWRTVFGYEFPFYFVQISPYQYRGVNAALLREAQLQTMASTPRTGMAVTMDIGNLRDIHPKNKQEVGRRLALWALARDYRHDLVPSGPIYKSHAVADGTVRIRFDFAEAGLSTRDGKPPSHLEVAGSDGVFHPATGKIVGSELLVSSDKVVAPQAVRYAFSSEAMPNLANKEGLPASSFRTSGEAKQ